MTKKNEVRAWLLVMCCLTGGSLILTLSSGSPFYARLLGWVVTGYFLVQVERNYRWMRKILREDELKSELSEAREA